MQKPFNRLLNDNKTPNVDNDSGGISLQQNLGTDVSIILFVLDMNEIGTQNCKLVLHVICI
jgi:hypothetical protein